MDTFFQEEIKEQKKNAGPWSKMNYIQRTGVLGSFPFLILSAIYHGRVGIALGLIGWTWIFLGYVAGYLWRFRHALHFWWSLAFACAAHIALLPIYANLIPKMAIAEKDGKAFMYLAFLLLIIEVLTLIYALKNVGMWIHSRTHEPGELERTK